MKATSSPLAHVNEHDLRRAKSYLDAAEAYMNWITSQPQLDLPESSPLEIDLGEPEALEMPENEALADLLAMYDRLEKEMGWSQSSRMGDSIISHDENRFRAIIEKMRLFLDDYVAQVLPLDVPESSPLREQTGEGRTGV